MNTKKDYFMDKSKKLFDESKFVRKKIPEQIEFETSMKDFLPEFGEIFKEAFHMTQKERALKKPNFRDRNWEAVTMSGNIKGLLTERFPEYILQDGYRYYFYMKDRYIIYFKKLDNKLLPSNIMTENTHKINCQYALPEEDPIPVIFIGYTVNTTFDELTGYYAVCMKDEEKKWVSDLSFQHSKSSFGSYINEDSEENVSMVRLKDNKKNRNSS